MRARAIRVSAAVFAFGWLVLPGFGLIDLAVTWSPDWPQVLEAGWGLYFTIFVGLPFVVVAARPRLATPAVAQLVVATGVLVASAGIARETRLLWVALALAIQTAIVAWVPRPALRLSPLRRVSRSLALLAAVGLGPWLVYAERMYDANREQRFDADISIGIDHYAVQGAVGLALAVLGALAALWAQGRRFVGSSVGVVACYLGLVSFAWPDAAGGFARGWSLAAMGWGVAFAAVASRARDAGY